MKINQALNLLALATALTTGAALAQTTPTGTATNTTTPTGAVAPDSTPASGRTTNRNRANRRRGRGTQTSANQSTGRSQDDKYRGSSAANGTSINNSNSTNYNSNNATTAPTGVGSNPASSGTTSTTTNNPDLSQSGSTSGSGSTLSGGSSMSAGSAPKPGAATGTDIAVKTARTTEEPAVAVGSTNRSTSINDFVASSPNFTTLQNAIQSAGLSDTFKGIDPFTVFAPSNSAFKKLPTAAQNTLLEGRNRSALASLLSYHVVKGTVDTAELKRRIKAGNGKARLETLTGGTLTAQMGANDQITLTDEQGGTARVDAADTYQTNGVVHGVDAVLSPKGGTAAFR